MSSPVYLVLKRLTERNFSVFKTTPKHTFIVGYGQSGLSNDDLLRIVQELKRAGYARTYQKKAGPQHINKTFTEYQITTKGLKLLRELEGLAD